MPVRAVQVKFQANSIMALTDRVTGRFLGGPFRQAVTDVHTNAAITVQEGMVDSLRKSIKATGRKQRAGERLEMALLDEQNRQVTSSGYSVLRPSWMNRSPAALYWRRIEEGDKATFGSFILFSDGPGTKLVAPWRKGGARPSPAGYKNMRMPQHRGAWVADIGPYPEYAYTKGGVRASRRFPYAQRYRVALKNVGIDFDTQAH